MMDIQEKCEAFEANFKTTEIYSRECAIRKKDILEFSPTMGGYFNIIANNAWQLWQAAKASAVPEWISVDERMPKEGEEVLVHSYGRVQQATCDLAWAGGFKTRNCYGWQATYGQSHWMPKSIKLPESFHFYYEHDAKVAKEKAMIEAQEPSHD